MKKYPVLLLVMIMVLLLISLSACKAISPRKTAAVVTTPEQVNLTSAPTLPQSPTQTPREKSIQEMLAVVDAVENYHTDIGIYPTSITDLVPVYLAELPFTNEGFEITYSLHEKYIYEVSFWPTTNRYCSFVKRDDYWECGFYVEH
ncbi:MAG TPA: hypothetical protein PKH92_09360 [Anaerolineaceae bacterium]|nr:hypothetical protein [Anaerolineaceae bacterium]